RISRLQYFPFKIEFIIVIRIDCHQIPAFHGLSIRKRRHVPTIDFMDLAVFDFPKCCLHVLTPQITPSIKSFAIEQQFPTFLYLMIAQKIALGGAWLRFLDLFIYFVLTAKKKYG